MRSNNPPPQNIEAENTLLGSLIIDPSSFDKISDLLDPDEFYNENNTILYRSMRDMYLQGEPIDIISLSSHLEEKKVLEKIGGRSKLATLAAGVGIIANLENYVNIIKRKCTLRRLITVGKQIEELGHTEENEVDDLLEKASKKINWVAEKYTRKKVFAPNADHNLYDYQDLVERIEAMPELEKVPTYFEKLDECLDGGLQAGEVVALSGITKHGKCLGKGTEILMHNGSTKKVENIVVGDIVMGYNSQPRTVMSLGRGREMMYRVTLRNGDSFTCNESHILSLRSTGSCSHGRYSKGKIVNISVKDYLKKSNGFKHIYKSYKDGIDFKECDLEIDPYFLGLWLGDGTSENANITTADKPISSWLKKHATNLGMKFVERICSNNGLAKTYCTTSLVKNRISMSNSLQSRLRKMDLLGNKHIPKKYKINSRENRLKLLAGLIDSDGNLSGKYNIEFCNKNKVLIDDVLFLARSLGFSARVSPRITRGFGVICHSFRVQLGGDFSDLPLLLKRKMPVGGITKKNILNYSFKVEKIGIDDYYGFTINEDHLFLLGDFTVTHNSTFSQSMTYLQACKGIPSLWFTLEMSWQELTRKFMKMDWEYQVTNKTRMLPIFYPIDNGGLSLDWIEMQIMKAKKELGIKIAYIDHLHFLLPLTGNMNNVSFVIGGIVQEIKNIAVRCEIPIVLMCHSKKIDVDTEPDLNSMRDSSMIAQTTDFTLLIYRKRNEKSTNKKGEESSGDSQEIYSDKTVLSLEANRRNGKTIRFFLGMINGRFHDFEDYKFMRDEELRGTLKQEESEESKLPTFEEELIISNDLFDEVT